MKRLVCICLSVCLVFISSFAISLGSSSTAEAAPAITTYNGDFASGLVGVRYVSSDSSVISTDLSVSTSGSTWRHHYSVPMGVSFTLNTHSTGSHIGKYISGFFSVDLETAWSVSSGEITKRDYSFVGSSASGEGWTTGFYYNNDTYDVSAYLILDNYPITYTDASQTHFRVDLTNNFSVNVTSQSCVGIYGCNLTHPGLNDYVISTGPNVELSNIITNAITQAPVISDMAQVLEDIKQQDEELFGEVVENLADQGVQMDEMVDEQKETNNIITDFFGGFFDNLLSGLLGLFIPSSEYFGEWFDELKNFFAEKFGFLGYPVVKMIDLCQIFLSGSDEDPVIVTPELAYDGMVYMPSYEINLLGWGEWAYRLRDLIHLVMNAALSFGLINLGYQRYKEIEGGGLG